MKRVETQPYTIGAHFAALVANGDATGLTDEEEALFADLERDARDSAPDGYTFSHWAVDTDDRDEFARCDATGLRGECYRFDAIYFHKDA